MIQIITKNVDMYKEKFFNNEVEFSNFNDYKSFDLYDINIINLDSSSLWECNSSRGDSLNDKSDLLTIKNAINTSRTKVLLFFPQNHYFRYDYSEYTNKFRTSLQLKSINEKVSRFITEYIYDPLPRFSYEKGVTKLDGEEYSSDFYFVEEEGVILCEKSQKNNTMKLSDRVVITTLSIFETPVNKEIEKRLFVFLNKVGFLIKNESIPSWIENIDFYDDYIYKEEIEKSVIAIKKLNEVIEENQNKINDNLKYKSILYSSGKNLSEQINNMLKQIFDLGDEFKDVYEEDFKFKAGGITFIVETKGLNNEVSGQNVSDAYNHLVIYEDVLDAKGVEEETKCLFFVANERLKEPNKRNKIKERQITIAKRNKTLIVETTTFYKIFENFMKDEITTDEIIELFKQDTGLLEYEVGKED